MPRTDPFDDTPHPGATDTAERPTDPRAEMDALRTVGPLVRASEYADLFASVPRAPRDPADLLRRAEWVGSRMGADALYSWEAAGTRGKTLVEGPTIGLAYALVSEWGDTATRALLVERSAMRAKFRGEFIDLQRRNLVVREYVFTLSPPPGRFAAVDQRSRWETMQEQSAASKAVRGAILAGLPAWFVEAAVAAAKERISGEALTVPGEGGQAVRLTLEEALGRAVAAFGRLGVSAPELEAWTGQPAPLWTLSTLQGLRRLAASIRSGETTASAALAETREAMKAAARGVEAAGPSPAAAMAERLGMARPVPPVPVAAPVAIPPVEAPPPVAAPPALPTRQVREPVPVASDSDDLFGEDG